MKKELNIANKRTKIIATLGPSITQQIFCYEDLKNPKKKKDIELAYTKMREIILNGVTCVRLNLSHGTHEEHAIRIKIARDVAKELNRNIAIMIDTKGPEIRIDKCKETRVPIKENDEIDIFTRKKVIGNSKQFSCSDSSGTYNMANDVKKGSIILVDDGKLQLFVDEVMPELGLIKTVALNKHFIGEKKRINLPGCEYSIPFLSKKDIEDIEFACKQNADYIAASFTNNAQNIRDIREQLRKHNKLNIQIVAKIETSNGIKCIDEIYAEADGVMVARGDLALEIPFYDVPYWQKQMIRKGRFTGKPCIVATQMLDSLERSLQPTRAEVTDVFFAVERGADATMLSGESAQGQFPAEAVKTMAAIDERGEILFDYEHSIKDYFSLTTFDKNTKKIAIKIADKVKPTGDIITSELNPVAHKFNPIFPYNAVVLFSDDKYLIRAISNIRPAAIIMVVTSEPEILNSFAINYAIQTYLVDDLNRAKEDYKNISHRALTTIFKDKYKAIAFFDKKFHELI